MSITTTRPHDTTPDAPRPARLMGRVVFASLATGVVLAVVLTLAVFAGGSEHTITGTALLAFAAGWATLAALTSRSTTQPQRWARVPATAMAVAGAGLLTLAPDQDTLTAAGWVWPPVLLALALWSLVRVRAAMTGRARWAVHVLLIGLVVAAVGGAVETVALAHDKTTVVMPGQRYDIGGRQLHLTCQGTGSPTVVLLSGTGEMSVSWARIVPQVSPTTRVCAYDRAGQGWSDDAPHPQDAVEMAGDLHELLAVAGEHGPFVLAGHSLGGVYSLAFAAQYPNLVAGMVLLDSTSPEQFAALPAYPGQYQLIRRVYSVAPSMARLGLARLFSSLASSTLPQPAASQVRAFESSSRGLENARNEVSRYRDAMRQAQALSTLADKPLVVVTASGSVKDTAGWSAAQDKLAALSTNTKHVVVDATHEGVVDDPRGSAASADAIGRAAAEVRSAMLVSSAG